VIVALEGLPGSGKTTTAKLLAEERGGSYVHEASAKHPFLDAFYGDMERYKFETELCFVLLHYHQYRDLNRDARGLVILDYSPIKDLVFADLNLTGEDYEVFSAVYARTSGSLAVPDVAVFLDLELQQTLNRIHDRGREYEQNIDPEYLKRLGEAYEARYAQLGSRVERVKIAPDWTREDVSDAVARAIG
jgi:deoxyadenosine/deoxycytidine kinase